MPCPYSFREACYNPARITGNGQAMDKKQHLIWIDLEMTGLLPDTDRIIEIATIVTNTDLQVIAEGPVLAVHQPKSIMEAMDDWNRKHHGQNGLIERVRLSPYGESEAEQIVVNFLQQYCERGHSPMCGNSICQDRRFLARYMPRLESFFHYRNLDVSTLKELSKRWKPEVYASFKKRQKHTALADVHESIDEMLHYKQHFLNLD